MFPLIAALCDIGRPVGSRPASHPQNPRFDGQNSVSRRDGVRVSPDRVVLVRHKGLLPPGTFWRCPQVLMDRPDGPILRQRRTR